MLMSKFVLCLLIATSFVFGTGLFVMGYDDFGRIMDPFIAESLGAPFWNNWERVVINWQDSFTPALLYAADITGFLTSFKTSEYEVAYALFMVKQGKGRFVYHAGYSTEDAQKLYIASLLLANKAFTTFNSDIVWVVGMWNQKFLVSCVFGIQNESKVLLGACEVDNR